MNPNPTTSVEKIAKQVESEWQMGGLSDGLYMDFTREVSRRLITSLLEGLVEEAEAWIFRSSQSKMRTMLGS